MADTPGSNIVATCPLTPQPVVTKKFRVSVYFDGTKNNKHNIDSNNSGLSTNKSDSYFAEYSNVARLFDNFREHADVDYSFQIYIDGMGTTRGADDDFWGYTTGVGDTGIESRVKEAIAGLVEQIKRRNPPNFKIEYVHVDVFGFSRGAASARHFVHQILKVEGQTLLDRLKNEGLRVAAVAVKFVGLFDTVSSFGKSFSDDTAQLGLDAIAAAEAVVHLVAAEEYRAKFALTDIRSAAHGIEILLPGAHSDVGGGYKKTEDEVDLLLFDSTGYFAFPKDRQAARDRDKQWLIDSGWYSDAQLTISDTPYTTITANRKGICYRYSFIPLRLMQEFAAQKGSLHNPKLHEKYVIPKDLLWLWERVAEHLAGRGKGTCIDWRNEHTADMHALRSKYLHFSAYYNSLTVHNPRWSDDDPIKGYRERQIHAG